jgi:hypothetical protein
MSLSSSRLFMMGRAVSGATTWESGGVFRMRRSKVSAAFFRITGLEALLCCKTQLIFMNLFFCAEKHVPSIASLYCLQACTRACSFSKSTSDAPMSLTLQPYTSLRCILPQKGIRTIDRQ